MWVSVRANVRVSSAARRSAREALQVVDGSQLLCQLLQIHVHVLKIGKNVQIAVRAGGFSALVVVGMAVIGIAILYAIFYVLLGVDTPGSMKVTDCMSSLCLFMNFFCCTITKLDFTCP